MTPGDPARYDSDRGLARVAGLVAGASSPDAVEAAVTDEARQLTGAGHVRIVAGGDDGPDGLLARAAAQTGRTAIEGPASTPTAIAASLRPGVTEGPALVVRAVPGGALDPSIAEALARLALIAGMGIASARVMERTSALVESGMIIGRGLDLDAVLRRVVESARRVVGARYAALGVLAPDHESLSRFIWSGFDDATAMSIGQLPSGRGLLGKIITDPRALRVEHIGGHPASSGFPAGHPPMETFLGVPVSLGNQIFGNLYLTDREGGPFTDEDERIAITLAAQAAVAIANARAAADERARLAESAALQAAHQRAQAAADGHRGAIRAQEAERARVARELHDETGQMLTAVALELRALDGHLDAEGRDRLAGVRRILASASESLRDLAIGLRPSGLAEHGLESALERQAACLRAGGLTNVDIAMAGMPPDLPEEVEIAVFRVVQEALTNVQRHAHARNAGVLVTAKGDRIRVLVEDDGVGFTPADPTDRLGLTGMRERIALIGGEVTVESSPGKGAVIVVEIPLRGGTAEQRS